MMRKAEVPTVPQEGSAPWLVRQCRAAGLMLGLTGALSACDPGVAPGTIGHVQGFAGIIASDEPQSVLVARDILSSGGTAADAAIAMYFAMSVTLPSRVGMAGQGACLVHNPKDKKKESTTESLIFIPQSPAAVAAPRAMFALHAKYGRLRWEALIGPAEGMARLGAPVSRALASDLALEGERLLADPNLRKIFARPDGRLAGEGDAVKNINLSSFMARLRARGPADLYTGNLARELSEAAGEAGLALTPEEMRNVKVTFGPTLGVKFGNLTAHFPPEPASGGAEEARLWRQVVQKQPYEQPFSQESASGAGFMVADRDGQAVVCATSMGGLFGNRKSIPGLGLILASGQVAKTSLGPMLVVAHNVTEFRYAMTSAGGQPGVMGLMKAASMAILEERPLVDAVKSVAGRRLVAIGCPQGLPPHPDSCQLAVDPEGFGYGLGVGSKEKEWF
ncbi:MAG: gamma-glutamyltransferase [Alphaproteobacteria bacterium]|nr:gamma-glutamyltransferase [Alphaproteobacteria bacterium]